MDGMMTGLLILIAVGGILIGALFVMIYQRSKGGRKVMQESADYREQQEERKKAILDAATTKKLRDFMEFDTIEDDMIVQNGGTRYCMAIRCQGINYDLMSEPEMLAVEEGFANFLNTLKFSIQLYVQSRTLDLTEGVTLYKKRMADIKADAEKYIDAVSRAKATNPNLTVAQKQQMDYEVKKKKNLIDYGEDIITYVERMSANNNILQRKYFIILSYETAEMGLATNFSIDEAREVAYSELYTRCKTIQAAISACGIETELLNSEDLAELLFVAYNKEDSKSYNIRNAIKNGVYRLYSTAASVLDKKKAALDAKLRDDAITTAETALKKAMDNLRNSSSFDITGLTEDEQYEDDTKREAMQIILENQDNLDPQAVDMALEDINSSMHRPLVAQEELDAINGEDQPMFDESGALNSSNSTANEISSTLNKDAKPLEDM